MVITQPMPSMPVRLWNDDDGELYRRTYFADFPGVWRQGDFFKVNERGGCFVLGRSDATLNRYGIRIGTAEIYAALESVAEVADALIVNLDLPGGGFFMPLFVTLTEGAVLDDALRDKIGERIRAEYTRAACPRPDHRGARDPGHPDRQEDGGTGPQDPARSQAGRRRQPQRDGEPAGPGRLRPLREHPAGLPPRLSRGISPGRPA